MKDMEQIQYLKTASTTPVNENNYILSRSDVANRMIEPENLERIYITPSGDSLCIFFKDGTHLGFKINEKWCYE